MASISVIVPVYNVEEYLSRCLDSILCQTFPDYDLIVINDGSTDGSGKICEKYSLLDERIHVLHQNNHGLSAARNTGIDWAMANSDSQWLTFIDSDDWVHPQYLEYLMKAVEDTNTKIAVCQHDRVSSFEQMELMSTPEVSLISADEFWLNDNLTATVAWGKIYVKELFMHIRYPEGKLHEDEFVTYRLLFDNKQVSLLHAKLYFYFINDNGITLSPWKAARLDALDAKLEQLDYFKTHEFTWMYQNQARKFIRLCAKSIDKIEDNVSDPAERVRLRKKWIAVLRKFIKSNKNTVSFKNGPRAYLYTLPGAYIIYLPIKKLIRILAGDK